METSLAVDSLPSNFDIDGECGSAQLLGIWVSRLLFFSTGGRIGICISNLSIIYGYFVVSGNCSIPWVSTIVITEIIF
jgi:hypothetical protein